MASYTLPEQITGIPLFVPDENDFFSIGVAAMPNGDDCLVVRGDLSTDYKAFQRSQVLSPPVFTSRTYATVLNVMSIVVWVRCSALTFAGSGFSQAIMFAVMNALAAPLSITDTVWARTSAVWFVSAGTSSVNTVRMSKFSASSGVGASASAEALVPTDTWTMLTFIPGSPTDPFSGVFVNDEVTRPSTAIWTAANDGTFPATVQPNQFFSIGSYTTHANLKSRADQWRMGKLSFHSGKLNATERALLYNAMMFGP